MGVASGYDGQPGYRPCGCWMCDDAAERGCRRLALPADAPIRPRGFDDNPFPRFHLFRWGGHSVAA